MDYPDATIKQAVLTILSRGQATRAEAAHLAGRSRQLVRHWAKGLPPGEARDVYLRTKWAQALKHANRKEPTNAKRQVRSHRAD
jgi:hypothetical protein